MADDPVRLATTVLHWASLAFVVGGLLWVRRRAPRASWLGLSAVAPLVGWTVACRVPFLRDARPDWLVPRGEMYLARLTTVWLYAGLIWAVLIDRPPPAAAD